MESKKNKSIDQYYGLLTDIGLVLALSLTFMAFKIQVKPWVFVPLESAVEEECFEFVPNTIEKHEKKVIVKEEPLFKEKGPIFILSVGPVVEPLDTTLFEIGDDDVIIPSPEEILGEYNGKDEPVLDPKMLSKLPEFPGGMAAFTQFLKENLRYPTFEKELGISGKVTLKIEIGEHGFVQNVQIKESSTQNFNTEALRVCKKIPQWKPGKQNDTNVKCWFLVPIVFRTQG